jgi:hypothetical protein
MRVISRSQSQTALLPVEIAQIFFRGTAAVHMGGVDLVVGRETGNSRGGRRRRGGCGRTWLIDSHGAQDDREFGFGGGDMVLIWEMEVSTTFIRYL